MKQLLCALWMLATFAAGIYALVIAYTLRRSYSRVEMFRNIGIAFAFIAWEVGWADARHFTFSAEAMPLGFYVMGLIGRVPELVALGWLHYQFMPSDRNGSK